MSVIILAINNSLTSHDPNQNYGLDSLSSVLHSMHTEALYHDVSPPTLRTHAT